MEDMRTYVQEELQQNENFKLLQDSGPECSSIITQIAEEAQGVWLWVYFVTRDLVHAVNRNEGISTLQKILREFPPDLEAYFDHIIENIKDVYKEEMAQIFLTTIAQVQPLPLFVFSLLEKERLDADYAIKAQICPLSLEEVQTSDEKWKARIQNRCSDLVTVEDKDHPIFLLHPVDYLHRTVGDFLRERYYDKLKELAPGFNAYNSLCKMMLFLLKGLPEINRKDQISITKMIGIVDELLYYAHEVEKGDQLTATLSLIDLLDEVDRVNCQHTRSFGKHWTHIRDSPTGRGNDEYREGGKCNFLALAIQARLVKYTDAKLHSDMRHIKKNGRPLLDYALPPRRVTPISMPYHSLRDDPSVDIGMVKLLLENGADPNQKVHLNDGRTVWALFLSSCYEGLQVGEAPPQSLRDAWYQASEQLISHGASPVCWFDDDPKSLTVLGMLYEIFGEGEARRLQVLLDEHRQVRREKRSWISNLLGWDD
ncbi:hypothetical protein TrVGV298_006444 [Trichoderma virens]|nr:hypothetical protein TrVGV298_006444 [Trichoderma virens]